VAGEIGVDKLVELTRFATAATETDLLRWAKKVSGAAVRRRADLLARRDIDEVRDVELSRSVSWWYFDEGKRFGLEADLPGLRLHLPRVRDPPLPSSPSRPLVESRRSHHPRQPDLGVLVPPHSRA
jgi:hypothetical protein